jgi:hypothetical protein
MLSDGSTLNVTFLMREKIAFDVWVRRGYVTELALGYSVSNLDTIKFFDHWPYVENIYEYSSWNVTDITSLGRCEVKETSNYARQWYNIKAVCSVSSFTPGTSF